MAQITQLEVMLKNDEMSLEKLSLQLKQAQLELSTADEAYVLEMSVAKLAMYLKACGCAWCFLFGVRGSRSDAPRAHRL